jgi:hypothetical protein
VGVNVRVCIPWRPGDAGRSEAWTLIERFWRDHGFAPVLADSDPDKPFNRGQARNRAAEGAWDVAVFADACVLPQIQNVRRAIDAAYNVRLVHAHSRVMRLSMAGTRFVLDGKPPQSANVARTTGPWTPGGVFAIGRGLYDRIGGWDEGFVKWGGEDSALVTAARTFGTVVGMPGDAWHLWHAHSDRVPKDPVMRARVRRYYAVSGNREAMSELIRSRSRA